MVFPQAKMCWENFDMTGKGDLTYLTEDGPQMEFMKAIVENARKPLLKGRDFDYQGKNYEPKTAYNYPQDFFTNGIPG